MSLNDHDFKEKKPRSFEDAFTMYIKKYKPIRATTKDYHVRIGILNYGRKKNGEEIKRNLGRKLK